MQLILQQGRMLHEFDLADDSTVEQLHEQIETRLGILRRRQKLIYKGKILMPHHTLAQSKVREPHLGQVFKFKNRNDSCLMIDSDNCHPAHTGSDALYIIAKPYQD